MDTIQINTAKEFITEHLKEEFSLNDLASSIGYSAFHLAREFKNSTSLSIMEYTRNEHILAASKELCNDFNICDIAMEYYFDTHAGFTRAFTAVFGCTPKEYESHTQKIKQPKGESCVWMSLSLVRQNGYSHLTLPITVLPDTAKNSVAVD